MNNCLELLIIFILFIYIFWLHYRLMKKNLFIDSIVERLSKLEKNWNKEYVKKFLNRLQHIDAESMITEDKILHENILAYITGNQGCKTFIHYTRQEETAKMILSQGFKFAESFHKTAEEIGSDQIDLIYKHSIRKYFGKFIIIICQSDKIISYYETHLKKLENVNLNVEQILTEISPILNENQEEIFTCPKQYVKGYLNYETGRIVSNPVFNPEYDSTIFAKNLAQAGNG